jgi:putative DNA primase/helicase
MNDPFAPISRANGRLPSKKKPVPATNIVAPVPPDAPAAPPHPTLGKPSRAWAYRDAAGHLLGFVQRFDASDGDKEVRPLTLWRSAADGKLKWEWKLWPLLRPLYGLDRLAAAPDVIVVVTEGEKAADAAGRLLPGCVAVTSPNGSKSAAKADWSPLKGRRVVVWPDCDAPGLAYAQHVSGLGLSAGAASIAIVAPPQDALPGWDAADAEAEGWTTERAVGLIDAALPFAAPPPAGSSEPPNSEDGQPGRRTPQRDVLMSLTEFVDLWHDANRDAFASFRVKGHIEHWPIRSRDFRMWLSGQYYERTGGAIGSQALEDGLRVLEARAVNEGPQHAHFIRVGSGHGKIYIDLGDPTWRAIEVSSIDWKVVEKSPCKFLRSPSIRPLPEPVHGALIESFRGFVNVKSDEDFKLVVAWLVASLRPKGPFPILVINGEAGSGKSNFSRMVRSLVDPRAAPDRAAPRDDRDLVVSASNSWVLAFDNLSFVAPWLADGLCRMSTGSGFATRQLHTDRDEMIFEAARPIILNGIPDLTDRQDLADRAVTIHLKTITEEQRWPEDEMLPALDRARPEILGALLDAVSRALRDIGEVKLLRVPRMADFTKWITAAESALGWDAGAFVDAYRENRRDATESTFEADTVATAIWKMLTLKHVDGFNGTATELLSEINEWAPEGTKRLKSWPQTPAQLGNAVSRAAPLLKAKGCAVERRHSGNRTITIIPRQGR